MSPGSAIHPAHLSCTFTFRPLFVFVFVLVPNELLAQGHDHPVGTGKKPGADLELNRQQMRMNVCRREYEDVGPG